MTRSRARLVIVLDRDGATARALGLLVEDWGYECAHAESLSTLLAQVEARWDDVVAIIADETVGDGTGEAVIEAARRRGVTAPALVLTGGTLGPLRRSEAGDGSIRRMQKPVAPERLKTWLDSVVANLDR